jgi:hypothetical protein
VSRLSALAALLALASGVVTGRAAGAEEPAPPAPASTYQVEYEVRMAPTERSAHVAIRIADPLHRLVSLRLAVDPERHVEFQGDGELRVEDRRLTWTPPAGGGALRYTVRLDHLRDEQSYDARCTRNWVLVRGDELVPAARVRARVGAHSSAVLRLRLPEGWSTVVPYPRRADGGYDVAYEHRRFDRPVGWMLFGHLGVLRERVAGAHVAIGAPVGHGMRRQDLLALLRWTLPSLRKIAPLPERLVIIGAGDPMWRGGLSGPRSAYLHASLPSLSEDATSPLLHEVVHAWMGARSARGGDWIVEGLAEYYSLEMLVRSRTISKRRHERALARLAEKGRSVRNVVAVEHASGTVSARAVGILRDLDGEIRSATGGVRSLDDVVRELTASPEAVSMARFRSVCERVSGTSLAAFFARSELAAPSGDA